MKRVEKVFRNLDRTWLLQSSHNVAWSLPALIPNTSPSPVSKNPRERGIRLRFQE